MDGWLLGLVGFAVATSVTPGPNNIMVTATAARFGLRRTLPHMLGIAVGFSAMIVLVGAGLAGTLLAHPALAMVLRVAALLWLLKLAWGIATAPPPAAGTGRPFGFRNAVLFQWVNPKAWLITLSIAAAWIRPDAPAVPQLLAIGLVFLVVGPPSNLPWALMGAGTSGLLRTPRQLRAFNVAMAVLLVVSMLPTLFS